MTSRISQSRGKSGSNGSSRTRRIPHLPKKPAVVSETNNRQFRESVGKQIAANPRHPLRGLLNDQGRLIGVKEDLNEEGRKRYDGAVKALNGLSPSERAPLEKIITRDDGTRKQWHELTSRDKQALGNAYEKEVLPQIRRETDATRAVDALFAESSKAKGNKLRPFEGTTQPELAETPKALDAGHGTSKSAGGKYVMLQSSFENREQGRDEGGRKGAIMERRGEVIGGVPVERGTSANLVKNGLLSQKAVDRAPIVVQTDKGLIAAPKPNGSAIAGARGGGAFGAAAATAMELRNGNGRITKEGAQAIGQSAAFGTAAGYADSIGARVLGNNFNRVAGNVYAKGVQSLASGGVVSRGTASVMARTAGTSLSSIASAEGTALLKNGAGRIAGGNVVGAALTAGVSAYENRDGLKRGDSQAIGNVAADTGVGLGSVAASAAAGAAIGSVIPGAGTLVGGAAGLVVGGIVAYGANKSGLRDAMADGASKAVDGIKRLFG